jgi:hypothetical protein
MDRRNIFSFNVLLGIYLNCPRKIVQKRSFLCHVNPVQGLLKSQVLVSYSSGFPFKNTVFLHSFLTYSQLSWPSFTSHLLSEGKNYLSSYPWAGSQYNCPHNLPGFFPTFSSLQFCALPFRPRWRFLFYPFLFNGYYLYCTTCLQFRFNRCFVSVDWHSYFLCWQVA